MSRRYKGMSDLLELQVEPDDITIEEALGGPEAAREFFADVARHDREMEEIRNSKSGMIRGETPLGRLWSIVLFLILFVGFPITLLSFGVRWLLTGKSGDPIQWSASKVMNE